MIAIEDQAAGEGPEVKSGDSVTIKYAGSFPDGRSFDSGQFDFQVGAGRVIPGFDMGVMGMRKGGRRKITVPPEMGYGERGAGGVIPPNATLVFEIEVLKIS